MNAPVLEASGVELRYGAARTFKFDRVTVKRGEALAVVGPSGSGKSTLLRGLALLQPIASGTITCEGQQIFRAEGSAIDEDSYRRNVVLVHQEGYLWPNRRVHENVTLASLALGKNPDHTNERARSLIEALDLGSIASSYPHEISGGQRQRVAIARALVAEPKVLLLDEPTSSLDEETATLVVDALNRFLLDSGALVMATHNANLLRVLADKYLMIEGGSIAARGDANELFQEGAPTRAMAFVSGFAKVAHRRARMAAPPQ
ncbi:MAG: ATP-binding cassette domain-containing protein [Terricaulis sp.]